LLLALRRPQPSTPFPYTTLFRSPPRLLMLMCLPPANHGGQTLLTDGQAVAEDLVRTEPETLRVLSGPHTAYFGGAAGHAGSIFRSEEHTSELQSRFDLVCRLLLE